MSQTIRHFLSIEDFDSDTLQRILDLAKTIKAGKITHPLLPGKHLAMIFEKPSTRTRVSFQVGIQQLGGYAVIMDRESSQLGHGESITDTSRVLSRFIDAIMVRTSCEEKLRDLADCASVPVINGLTDRTHPCQLMADMLTYQEHRVSIKGKSVCWIGDGNNVANSFIHCAARFGFAIKLATPRELAPSRCLLDWAVSQGVDVEVTEDMNKAVSDSDLVVTDTWVSMGQKGAERRKALLSSYQVNEEVMSRAKSDALFMHCLPAHRGEEATDGVLDGAQSVIFDEAENRLHAQKAILVWCLRDDAFDLIAS